MKFVISYAYEVPHYADFVVNARDKNAAFKKAKAALRTGRFSGASCQPDDSMWNERVFVMRKAGELDEDCDAL